MKILLIDPTASFLDFAMRCEAEGHEVRWFLGPDKDGSRYPVGDGLVCKVPAWEPHMKWADLILNSDNAKYTDSLESWRARGYPLWASNRECTRWELDRAAGQRVLEDHGIATIPALPFKSFDDAIAHQLAHRDTRFVCKPNGDVDKALSYVSSSFHDMVFMLQYWKKNCKRTEFIFQEFTPGIEMAVGGWMGRDGFLPFFLENFEFKKLMPGEKGPNTGEMGTAMKYCTADESLLAREMLLPLQSELIRQGYTGYIDVAVIIDKQGCPWPLEFTTRPGWPLFQIQQVLHPEPCVWMKDALEGWQTFTPYRDIALGVVVTMPNFPYGTKPRRENCGFPVWGIDNRNRYNIHPCEMMLGEGIGDSGKPEPMLVTAGDYVMVVSGTGESVSAARERAYETLKGVEVPNSPIYRIDIGSRLEEQLPQLQKLGYATSWCWG